MKNDSIHFMSKLIIKSIVPLIFIISTMTSIRISFFGLAEILIIVIFLFLIINDLVKGNLKIRNYVFSRFWLSQLFVMFIGLSINIFFRIDANSNPIFDLFSYVFVLISCLTFERLFYNVDSEDILDTLNNIYIFGTCFFYAIFIISKSRSTIFGYNMYFGGVRFSPFADNPHQFGCLISMFPFIGYKMFDREKSIVRKVINLLMIIFNIQMGIATGNDTLIVLWLFCFIILLYYKMEKGIKSNIKKKYFFILIISIIIICLLVFLKNVSDVIYNLFVVRDMGGARIKLWINGVSAGYKSFLFGLGPGAHSGFYGPYEGVETHNMFLQLFTQSGIIGVFIYILLIKKLFRLIDIDYKIGICLVGIFILGLSGNGLRRLVNWLYRVIIYYYLINKNEDEVHSNKIQDYLVS